MTIYIFKININGKIKILKFKNISKLQIITNKVVCISLNKCSFHHFHFVTLHFFIKAFDIICKMF